MSAYTDLDIQPSEPSKSQVAAFVDDARGRYGALRDKGIDLAGASSRRAADLARAAGDQVRRKPITTGVIAAAIGVGLVFLLSSRARAGAASAGQALWGAIRG
jgi:ElaB/YqjD/DUF883 family membrane-anchored ribosome-binding protein